MSDLEQRVDQLLSEFDSWFQSKGNEPMSRPERAITKTFCWFLVNVRDRSTIPELQASDKEKKDGP